MHRSSPSTARVRRSRRPLLPRLPLHRPRALRPRLELLPRRPLAPSLGMRRLAMPRVATRRPLRPRRKAARSSRLSRAPVESILVAYDELDFPAGVVRLKQGGGAGGHNGMRDIIAQMGDPFWRLRIGIGHPGDKSAVLNYVLGRPQAEEERQIFEAIQA